jgi:hypothetical protein
MNTQRERRSGVALVMAILCLTILLMVFGSLTRMAFAERGQVRAEERRLRAGWLAESGLERAWARHSLSPSYRGETWTLSPKTLGGRDGATVRILVEPVRDDPSHLRVSARADYPSDGVSRARQTRTTVFRANKANAPANPGVEP